MLYAPKLFPSESLFEFVQRIEKPVRQSHAPSDPNASAQLRSILLTSPVCASLCSPAYHYDNAQLLNYSYASLVELERPVKKQQPTSLKCRFCNRTDHNKANCYANQRQPALAAAAEDDEPPAPTRTSPRFSNNSGKLETESSLPTYDLDEATALETGDLDHDKDTDEDVQNTDSDMFSPSD